MIFKLPKANGRRSDIIRHLVMKEEFNLSLVDEINNNNNKVIMEEVIDAKPGMLSSYEN